MTDTVRYLRRAQDQGLLVPFIGAGLGSSAASLPSWFDLLDHGIQFAIDEMGMSGDSDELQTSRELGAEGRLPEAFDYLMAAFGVGVGDTTNVAFESFLASQFATPTITNPELLKAIAYLNPTRILTTNYDRLLETWGIGGGRSVTWQEPASMRDIFRAGEGVVHIHGVWDRPSSVVLSRSSYDRVAKDMAARQIAQVIFHGSVLLFIATSLDGTHDPHLGDLLAEFESLVDKTRGEAAPHVMLVAGAVTGADRARLNRQGILPISYGTRYADLPEFLRRIGDTGQILISTGPLIDLLGVVNRSSSLDDALRAVGSWIQRDIFAGREVRVSFSEKVASDTGFELRRRAVVPINTSGNPHHYPLSISAWALVEGQPVLWPDDAERTAQFSWLKRIGKLDALDQLISDPTVEEFPELKSYVDVDLVREHFRNRSLQLKHFFQDWASDQMTIPYSQFLSVPVPWLQNVSTRGTPPEYGVYNIDSLETPPLLDRRTQELLRLASSVTATAFRMFSPG